MKSSSLLALFLALTLGSAIHAQPVHSEVRDFVRSSAFPRSYRELANSYDSSAVPELIEILNSESDEAYWGRAAGLLGAIGDDRAVDALIAFVQRPVPNRRLSYDEADAYTQAIMALGLLVNRIANDRALQYLIDGLTPSVWRQRNVQGIAPWASSYDEYDRLLSTYALMGLALSGTPRAADALKSLQDSPSSAQAQFRNGLDDTLAQWLEVHRLVVERGLAGMYDYYDGQRRQRAERFAEEADRLRAESKRGQVLRDAQQPR